MTPLRQRMTEDMQLRGLATATQQAYLRYVEQLAVFTGKSPDLVTEEEFRQFFLALHKQRGLSRSTATVAIAAFKFLFEHTLQRPSPRLDLFRPRPVQTLPVILSVDEVWRILSQLDHPTYYTCLATIYTCGLRISEGINLQVSWIDSARMQLQVRGGKGFKDRYIPLPARTLTLLRRQWLTHRNPVWLFPAGAGAHRDPHTATVPITSTSVRRAFQQARQAAGVTKAASVHSLRHSWATHLLEAGVNLRVRELWLGHRSPTTTAIYTHLTQKAQELASGVLDTLAAGIAMTTLGEIFRRYGPAYRARCGRSLSQSQLQAMQAIEACRTEALGGHVYSCPACQITRYSYHSCRNRHCPTCQQNATQAWLAEQHTLLLSVPYFLVTFTLPSELRAIARQQPKTIYALLFHASAAALQQLAQDPRFLGGQIGMLGVLQTWTRDLRYHPHVHYLVPALALTPDGKRWLVGKSDFLLHVKPLGQLFRAKFRAALRQMAWAGQVDVRTWAKPWVVDCRPVGSGASALKYLAPYIFRIALSNNRIERVANDAVTFRYTEGKTGAQNGPRCRSIPSSDDFWPTCCRKALSRFATTDCSTQASDNC